MSENCVWKKELDSGCSGAYIFQLCTAENSNSDAIYHFKSFLSQILPVRITNTDGSKSFPVGTHTDKAKGSVNLHRMLEGYGTCLLFLGENSML